MRRLFVFRPEPAARQTIRTAEARPRWCRSRSSSLRRSIGSHRIRAISTRSCSPVQTRCEWPESGWAISRPSRSRCGRGYGVLALPGSALRQWAMAGSMNCSPRFLPIRGCFIFAARIGVSHMAGGRSIASVAVYRANEKADVPGLQALEGQTAVVHSPRAARRLAGSYLRTPGRRSAWPRSARRPAEAAGHGWQEIRTAPVPRDTELLALAARLCET